MAEQMKECPLCGEEMRECTLHLCGKTTTLIHKCISGIEIKIQGESKSEVRRKWNTFVTVVNK